MNRLRRSRLKFHRPLPTRRLAQGIAQGFVKGVVAAVLAFWVLFAGSAARALVSYDEG